jgi:low affinity Fe/Cu permease
MVENREGIWEKLTGRVNKFLVTSHAFLIALFVLILWIFSFSLESKWHEAILEMVAMVSFLNMFIMQRGQNKELKAFHVKLDELIASSEVASNRLIKAEEAPEVLLDQIHKVYKDLAVAAADEDSRMRISPTEEADKLLDAIHLATDSASSAK